MIDHKLEFLTLVISHTISHCRGSTPCRAKPVCYCVLVAGHPLQSTKINHSDLSHRRLQPSFTKTIVYQDQHDHHSSKCSTINRHLTTIQHDQLSPPLATINRHKIHHDFVNSSAHLFTTMAQPPTTRLQAQPRHSAGAGLSTDAGHGGGLTRVGVRAGGSGHKGGWPQLRTLGHG